MSDKLSHAEELQQFLLVLRQQQQQQQQLQPPPPPPACCSAVPARLDWPPFASPIIYGLNQISIYSLSQPPPAKAVHGHGNPCIGANEPNRHPPHRFTIIFPFTSSISKLRPPTVIDALLFSLHSDVTYATSPRTFACHVRAETRTLSTRTRSRGVASATSPIALARTGVHSLSQSLSPSAWPRHRTDHTRSHLRALISQSFSLSAWPRH
jgi:hypothetical protein